MQLQGLAVCPSRADYGGFGETVCLCQYIEFAESGDPCGFAEFEEFSGLLAGQF